jgi:hypothetical protein
MFRFSILVISLLFFLTTCKKKPILHKLKYEIVFYITPPDWYPSITVLSAKPHYHDDEPSWSKFKPGDVWNYEYWELKDGDRVSLGLKGAAFENGTGNDLKWVYTLRVYVDGEVYAQKRFGHNHPDVEVFGADYPSDYEETLSFTYKEN